MARLASSTARSEPVPLHYDFIMDIGSQRKVGLSVIASRMLPRLEALQRKVRRGELSYAPCRIDMAV